MGNVLLSRISHYPSDRHAPFFGNVLKRCIQRSREADGCPKSFRFRLNCARAFCVRHERHKLSKCITLHQVGASWNPRID